VLAQGGRDVGPASDLEKRWVSATSARHGMGRGGPPRSQRGNFSGCKRQPSLCICREGPGAEGGGRGGGATSHHLPPRPQPLRLLARVRPASTSLVLVGHVHWPRMEGGPHRPPRIQPVSFGGVYAEESRSGARFSIAAQRHRRSPSVWERHSVVTWFAGGSGPEPSGAYGPPLPRHQPAQPQARVFPKRSHEWACSGPAGARAPRPATTARRCLQPARGEPILRCGPRRSYGAFLNLFFMGTRGGGTRRPAIQYRVVHFALGIFTLCPGPLPRLQVVELDRVEPGSPDTAFFAFAKLLASLRAAPRARDTVACSPCAGPGPAAVARQGVELVFFESPHDVRGSAHMTSCVRHLSPS
jgi:hypothetical protein